MEGAIMRTNGIAWERIIAIVGLFAVAVAAFASTVQAYVSWSGRNDYLRSTVSYGYVHLDNQFSQEPDAYHQTHYASLNLVWKARKRLSIGFEALY